MQKHSFFFWQCPFQTKLLFFQTVESAKCAFAARAGSGKPAVLHALFLKKLKANQHKKITGQCFLVKSKVTYKNSAHLDEKKTKQKAV